MDTTTEHYHLASLVVLGSCLGIGTGLGRLGNTLADASTLVDGSLGLGSVVVSSNMFNTITELPSCGHFSQAD